MSLAIPGRRFIPPGPKPGSKPRPKNRDERGAILIDLASIYSAMGVARKRSLLWAMFAAWFGVVAVLTSAHLFWRDEVRALSIARGGDHVFAMLNGLRGEGHPAVWYLLLRAAYTLVPRPEVLPFVSVFVAAAALLILVLRSPFSPLFLALILMTRFSVYEYSVMARNYGISMLLLFLFAALYERHRDRGCLLGGLLLLLANCNVHSVPLVGGLLIFWLVDILGGNTAERPRNLRVFFYNAALAALGVAACLATIFPTYNDSAGVDARNITFARVVKGILLPSLQFGEALLPGADRLALLMPRLRVPLTILQSSQSLILFGGTLGLVRRRGAFVAALVTLAGMSFFFATVAEGSYRHEALWLVFMICMYWLAAPRHAPTESAFRARPKPFSERLSTVGTALFVLLLLLQLPGSAYKIVQVVSARVAALPDRNDIKSILAKYPDLRQASIVADPDFLLETLPYYVPNATYLMREQRYGNVVHFTRKARLDLSLGDVMTNAARLRKETGRPVVILLSHEIDPSLPAKVYQEAYDWTFSVTPEQARAFQSSTRLLKHRAPAETSEEYYVYAMDK